jgi:hypothetical protein
MVSVMFYIEDSINVYLGGYDKEGMELETTDTIYLDCTDEEGVKIETTGIISNIGGSIGIYTITSKDTNIDYIAFGHIGYMIPITEIYFEP